MFTLRFAFKNIVSRKSSLVIILFIAFSIGLLVMVNAIFDSTGNGIEKTFSTSFTGDVVIRQKTDFPMSLFGDETPVTGELSELPRIIPYNNIYDYVKKLPEVKNTSPQLTGQAVIKIEDLNKQVVMFAVDFERYLDIMTGIKILSIEKSLMSDKSVMISESVKNSIENASNKELNLGDEIQFVSSNGSSYTLRTATICAFYTYEVHNDLQDNIVLVSPEVVRSLLGIESMSKDVVIEKNQSVLIDQFDNIESLFGEDELFLSSDDNLNENSSENINVENLPQQNDIDTTWNYIICKLNQNESVSKFVKKLNKYFNENEFNAVAVSWRAAAGMSAQYIYWMRLIFNIGLLLLIGTGFIVVNNTLVIAAMDRTKETGALRAIGANRKFIAIEYLFETLILTTVAGILGCIIGFFANQLIVSLNITFSNSYLIQLFGSNSLKPIVSFYNVLMGMLLSLALAIIGWLYPVHIALDASPVVAMEHI